VQTKPGEFHIRARVRKNLEIRHMLLDKFGGCVKIAGRQRMDTL